MTTQWGAGNGRRGDRWEAPRLAYELAAAYAGESAGGGGCGGPSFPQEAAKQWGELGPPERRDVIFALVAQARSAIRELARIRPGHEELAALRSALLLASGCDSERAETAVALCRVEIAAWTHAGFRLDRITAALAAAAL